MMACGEGTTENAVILCVHLYAKKKTAVLLRKLEPLLAISDQIWFSSASSTLLGTAKALIGPSHKPVRLFKVDNRWHDWSGYLAFLRANNPSNQLIVCNDSIVTRRVISRHTMLRFVASVNVGFPAIVGELDSTTHSVDLNGWSSACWISTYMFAIRGFGLDVPRLESQVECDVEGALSDRSHIFSRYIAERRSNVVVGECNRKAKLGAMFFERRLTQIAAKNGACIINYCAGSRMRKIERALERLRDA